MLLETFAIRHLSMHEQNLFLALYIRYFSIFFSFLKFSFVVRFHYHFKMAYGIWYTDTWHHLPMETRSKWINDIKKGRATKSRFIVIIAASFIQLHQFNRRQRCHRHPICITPCWLWPWATATFSCSGYH